MAKDGISTFTTRPGLWIDPELRLSTYWVIAALLCLGIVLPFVEEIIDASSKWLSFAQLAMLCYALAVVIWGLERWWPSLAGLSLSFYASSSIWRSSDLRYPPSTHY